MLEEKLELKVPLLVAVEVRVGLVETLLLRVALPLTVLLALREMEGEPEALVQVEALKLALEE